MNNFKYLILSDVNQDILDIRKEVFIAFINKICGLESRNIYYRTKRSLCKIRIYTGVYRCYILDYNVFVVGVYSFKYLFDLSNYSA